MIILSAVPLLIAVILHETAHGLVACALGDDTAKRSGRFKPYSHFDFFGSFLIPLLLYASGSPFLIGYAKPVPVNARNFKHPETDMALVALGGPICNVLLAFGGVFVLKNCEIHSPMFAQFIFNFIAVNFALFLFNIIPIPPLDGSRVLTALLPPRFAEKMYALEPFGFFILMGIETVCSLLSGVFGCRIGILAMLRSALKGFFELFL
jgi:Zn-dependent protease